MKGWHQRSNVPLKFILCGFNLLLVDPLTLDKFLSTNGRGLSVSRLQSGLGAFTHLWQTELDLLYNWDLSPL